MKNEISVRYSAPTVREVVVDRLQALCGSPDPSGISVDDGAFSGNTEIDW